MKSIFHVYIRPKANVSWPTIEATLSKATDWIRYDEGAYLIYSGRTVDKWQLLLMPHVNPDGSLLILKVDPKDYQGFMSAPLWAWLDEVQQKKGA